TVAGDSISKYVKNEYKQTFLAAWSTSSLFEEYYDVQVTEDELAGIALYIQAAIIRRKKGRPLTALLVSQRGMAACQLSIEMIKYSIPEITDVQAVSRHDFKLSLHPETDIIINGSGLVLDDSRVVTVEDRISETEI
ncbi:PRD domain-containing protein, partial [Clostridioides difficile]|nr:PRD domain-containing protein [Clostridioides difficile]